MKRNFNNGEIADADISLLLDKLREGKSIVVTGTNKSGKTLFMVNLFKELHKVLGDKLLPTCGDSIIHSFDDISVPYNDELELFTFLNEHKGRIIVMDEPFVLLRSVGLTNALIDRNNQFVVCAGKERNYENLIERKEIKELIVTVRIGLEGVTDKQRYYEIME